MPALPKHAPARIGKFWVAGGRRSGPDVVPGRASRSASPDLCRVVGESEKRLAQPAMGRVVVIGGVPQH